MINKDIILLEKLTGKKVVLEGKMMQYAIYIITYADTEVEKEFETKGELLDYCKSNLWVRDPEMSKVVRTFKLDKDGYKESYPTKFEKEENK